MDSTIIILPLLISSYTSIFINSFPLPPGMMNKIFGDIAELQNKNLDNILDNQYNNSTYYPRLDNNDFDKDYNDYIDYNDYNEIYYYNVNREDYLNNNLATALYVLKVLYITCITLVIIFIGIVFLMSKVMISTYSDTKTRKSRNYRDEDIELQPSNHI